MCASANYLCCKSFEIKAFGVGMNYCGIYFHALLKISQCICMYIPYPTAFPYGNGMVLHFYQQQESSTTKTVHKVINKGLKAYV